ncbi:spore coat associated protein CotJA [Desulfoscipio sp. XC116]|uniref:spore coat associated protein CotJA n=1 Tax=Desulfoscipio sp. XC116 TaxID=3144975 RepID=UPI00325AA4AC
MSNKDDRKPDQIKSQAKHKETDAATSIGTEPVHGQAGPVDPHQPLHPVDPMYTPFDPAQSDGLPPYPDQANFGPGYQTGHPAYPGYSDQAGCPEPGCPEYPGPPGVCPGTELARAYIPIQRLGKVNTPARALETGTLFPELYRPCPC